LDAIVKADPTQPAQSLTEMLESGVKSNLDIPDMELNLKIKLNTETGKFEVETV